MWAFCILNSWHVLQLCSHLSTTPFLIGRSPLKQYLSVFPFFLLPCLFPSLAAVSLFIKYSGLVMAGVLCEARAPVLGPSSRWHITQAGLWIFHEVRRGEDVPGSSQHLVGLRGNPALCSKAETVKYEKKSEEGRVWRDSQRGETAHAIERRINAGRLRRKKKLESWDKNITNTYT